ncbi:unnamed protein product [Peniophora sp. CBMAI 1063]|nr:unnamed protein product [Peniophora sp. CBMAI 1063]
MQRGNIVISFYKRDRTATFATQMFGDSGAAVLWSRILQADIRDDSRALVRDTRPHVGVQIRIDRCTPPPGALHDAHGWIMDYPCTTTSNQAERIVRQKLYTIKNGTGTPTRENTVRYRGLPAPFFFLREDVRGWNDWSVGVSLEEVHEDKAVTVLANHKHPYMQGMTEGGDTCSMWVIFPWKDEWHEYRIQPKARRLTNADFVRKVAGAIENIWNMLGIPVSSARASVKLIGVIYGSQSRLQVILEAPLTERLHEHSSW